MGKGRLGMTKGSGTECFLDVPRLLPPRQPSQPLPIVLSSGTRRAKSITVQIVQGLRGYQLRTGYALRLKPRHKRRDIGWRGIVHKSFSKWSHLTPHGQFTTTHQYPLSVPAMLAIGSGHGEVTGRIARYCSLQSMLLTRRPNFTTLMPISHPAIIYATNPGYPDTTSSGRMLARYETGITEKTRRVTGTGSRREVTGRG